MTRLRWVALLAVSTTAGYLCRVNVSVAGDGLMREFGWTQTELGRVFSAFLLGYALCMAPAGFLADRYGARRVLHAASWCWLAITLLLAAVPSSASALVLFLGLRVLLGVAESPAFPAAAQGVARYIAPVHQGRANGAVLAAVGAGSALAPALLAPVMTLWGWRGALLVSAIPAFLAASAWRYAREPQPIAAPAAAAPDAAALWRPLLSRPFILLTLSYTLQGYVGYIFVYWFYLYLVQVRHFDFLAGAFYGSLPWLLSIVSIPLGGWLHDRLPQSPRLIPITGLAGAGLLLAFGAHTPDGSLAAVCLALSTALVLSVESPFWTTMMKLAGERAGLGGGVMNTGSNLGGLISPALTPILAAFFGWESALHLAAGLALLAALLWLGIGDPPHRSIAGRGRDNGCPLPPAQTRAGAPNAHGSYLGCGDV